VFDDKSKEVLGLKAKSNPDIVAGEEVFE